MVVNVTLLKHIYNVDEHGFTFERFTVDEIKEAMKNVKSGKACGLDGIYGEHLQYADNKLYVILALLFNTMLIHGHIPIKFMDTILIPLIKDKR